MSKEIRIKVFTGTGGIAAGGEAVLASFKKILALANVEAIFNGGCSFQKVGCRGFCARDVLVDVIIDGMKTTYRYVKPDMVEKIVLDHIIHGNPVAEWTVG